MDAIPAPRFTLHEACAGDWWRLPLSVELPIAGSALGLAAPGPGPAGGAAAFADHLFDPSL